MYPATEALSRYRRLANTLVYPIVSGAFAAPFLLHSVSRFTKKKTLDSIQ